MKIKLNLFYSISKYQIHVINTGVGVARWSWWHLHHYSISGFIRSTFSGFYITSQLFSWSCFSKLEWYEFCLVIFAFLYQYWSNISIHQKIKSCYLPVQSEVKTTDFLIGSWNTIISGPTYSLFIGWTTGCCCWAAFLTKSDWMVREFMEGDKAVSSDLWLHPCLFNPSNIFWHIYGNSIENIKNYL